MSASPKLLAALAFSVGLFAGVASAAGEKLDLAHATTAKAIALLKESPAPASEQEAHRKKAIDLLTRAQSEILKAKGE
jgi:hypothetical protein